MAGVCCNGWYRCGLPYDAHCLGLVDLNRRSATDVRLHILEPYNDGLGCLPFVRVNKFRRAEHSCVCRATPTTELGWPMGTHVLDARATSHSRVEANKSWCYEISDAICLGIWRGTHVPNRDHGAKDVEMSADGQWNMLTGCILRQLRGTSGDWESIPYSCHK